MRILDSAKWTAVALAPAAALLFGSIGPASADPAEPPAPYVQSGDSVAPPQADGPAPEAAPSAATEATPTAVPHLSSLQNLPPYTTTNPEGSQDQDRLSYFRDVWHAIQNHEVTPKQALVLLAQRPMDPDAAPPAGVPDGPQAPGPVVGEAPPSE